MVALSRYNCSYSMMTTSLLLSSLLISETSALLIQPSRAPRRLHTSKNGVVTGSWCGERSRSIKSAPITALYQAAAATTDSSASKSSSSNSKSSKQQAAPGSSKPRFVIEKIGSGNGRRPGSSSSHASYYYSDYINDKVYRDISNLCIQNFFGDNESEIQQVIQTSKQKRELYQSLQPEELRSRRDDVKTVSEFFVAYELREATPEDTDEYHREQELQRQRGDQEENRPRSATATRSSASRRQQQHYNAHNQDYYYRVDHRVKSPAKMNSGYDDEPYSRFKSIDEDVEDSPVVMGGTLGGIAGRRQARKQAAAVDNRPLRRYRQNGVSSHQQRPQRYQVSRKRRSVPPNPTGDFSYPNGGSDGRSGNSFQSQRSSSYREARPFDCHGSAPAHDPFYNPYTMEEVDEPMVVGGNVGNVGPVTRRKRRVTRRGGPLFAHRRYQQFPNEFDYYQQPRSTSNNEGWGVEQPFLDDDHYEFEVETRRQQQQEQRQSHSQMAQKAAHTYSSSDQINFDYHYNPAAPESSVKHEGLPVDAAYRDVRQPSNGVHDCYQHQRAFRQHTDEEPSSHYSHSEAVGDALKKEAPMYVKGPLVGFVEIVHTPYSLGVLDDPEMLTAGMKPHRPVLRNLVVAKHAENSGIDARLLEACERHVQNHWQMKELVVEVDDLKDESLNSLVSGDTASAKDSSSRSDAPSAVEFYLGQGYEVVLSDPESERYDEKTGEVLGQIQCRRDVMRKCFDKSDDKAGVSENNLSTRGNDATSAQQKPRAAEAISSALDVEYAPSTPKNCDMAAHEFIDDSTSVRSEAALEVELITDPLEGPRQTKSNTGSSIACDPEGPSQSIFYSSNNFE